MTREVFGRGNEFAVKITYSAKKPRELIKTFRTSPNLRIAVTVLIAGLVVLAVPELAPELAQRRGVTRPLRWCLGVTAAGTVDFHVDVLGGEFGGEEFLIGHEFNGDGDFFIGAGAHVDDGNFFAQHEDQGGRWGDGVDR